jgi:hypothetical protein
MCIAITSTITLWQHRIAKMHRERVQNSTVLSTRVLISSRIPELMTSQAAVSSMMRFALSDSESAYNYTTCMNIEV